MATEYTWADGRLCGGGENRLQFIHRTTGKVVRFRGDAIPGVVVVLGSEYEKNGKWSKTEYRLAHGPSWVPCPTQKIGSAGWTSFADVRTLLERCAAEPVAVDAASAEAWARDVSPDHAARIDAAQGAMASLE